MAYTQPTAEEIRNRTGLNRHIERITDAQLDALLVSLVPFAEARARNAIAEAAGAEFASLTLTDDQATILQEAVILRTAVAYLTRPQIQKVTGSQAPLDMEGSEAFAAKADELLEEAQAVEKEIVAAIPSVTASASAGILASTYAPTSLTRSPSERIRQLAERTDEPAWSRE